MSASVNGVDAAGQARLPRPSSVTVNEAGADTFGASLTGMIPIVLLAERESWPSVTVVVSTRATVLFGGADR